MSKTRQRILDAARELFNEQGYSQVTVRMIAMKLGISSGNLNYYFQKREEILEALYFDMVSEFDNRVDDLPQIEISFPQIRSDIKTSMERMLSYKFIWTDLFNILRANEKIKNHFEAVYPKRISGYLFLYGELQKLQLMRPSSFEQEYQLLAERMVSFGDTWIYTSEVYNKSSTRQHLESQVKSMVLTLYPYLTEKGTLEFQTAFPEWFVE